MQYTILETPGLILRKFKPDDLDFIFNHFNSQFVSQYLYDNEPPKNINDFWTGV